ncbi:MAG TPA: ABC transporter ATP-binding protein [bacterium]|nr:ABC transporter ATP-binding protein [bacterium]
MAELALDGLGKAFGTRWAVRDLSLVVRDGEFVTLLGPSGCGKTTTLRMIAGFVAPTAGQIALGGRVLSSASTGAAVPPERRGMGMVFQSYAVWPHMTARANVAYPLHRSRLPRAEIEARTRRAMSLVHLDALGDRHPQELSGGQQQRVALARALVMEPSVLLLDEPLSNLDAKLREEMRTEITDLQERLGITVVYVTHDQAEAMALSGRIAVLREGRIIQTATPRDLYERPADPFVAAFVGAANFVPGAVVGRSAGWLRVRLPDGADGQVIDVPGATEGDRVLLCIRPEDLEFDPEGALRGTIVRATYLGSRVDYAIRIGSLTVRVEGGSGAGRPAGEAVRLRVTRAVAYPAPASGTTWSGVATT